MMTLLLLPDTSPKEFLFIMAFVIPCISIIVCYARIFYIVRKTALRSHESCGAIGNNSSIHIQTPKSNNQSKKIFSTNNNKNASDGTDVQLLSKNANSKEGLRSESETNGQNRCSSKALLDSDNSSSLSHSHSHGDIKSSLKFIDTSVESDFPPTLSALRKHSEEKKLTGADRNLSNVSISRTVEFIESNGERHNSCDRDYMTKLILDADSAVEESTSSADNNHVSAHNYSHREF